MSIKTQPEVQTIEHIPFAQPHIFDVTSSVKLLWMQEVANDTARLELYFDAGLIREKDSIPKIVKALLLSGTNDQSSTEIQEEIDGRGGYIDIDLGTEFAIVNIYCLKEQMLPIANQVFKAIQNLAFRDSEIQDALTSLSQEFKVSKQKVKSVVSEAFRLHSFADQEDYSWKTELEDFSEPKLVRYKRFWKEYYLQGLIRMTLVGNMEQDEVDALIDLFGKWSKIGSPIYGENFHCEPKRLHIPVKDAVQTAIRIGNFSVAKTNPDRHSFGLLNTILGGYFGSRLMTNIREDKGYTYGIGSGVLDYQNGTSFVVMTEVGNEVVDATLTEMKKEIERLKTELIAPEELTLVKNYMMGQLLRSADGPYAMLDLYNSVDMHNLTLDYYDQAILKINSITSEEIQEMAVKYLNWDDFVVATAG